MPRPKIPNIRKKTLEHKSRIEMYGKLIQEIYDKATKEACRLASLTDHNPEELFSFADYPMTKEAFEKLMEQFRVSLEGTIMSGISNEWKESNMIQDMVANKVLSAYVGSDRNGDEFKRYYQTNPDALKAFTRRKIAGMNLSTRVWNLKEQFKPELEMAISSAIAPGTSAQLLSQDVRKLLNEPDLMFRRFRYKDDEGHWKKKWKRRIRDDEGNVKFIDCDKDSYKNDWTGPGYYKSSYKNAMRLARTEINMAYRTAEQERWKQFDFVVGYEVHTTQNGTHDFGVKSEEDYKYRPARLQDLGKIHKPDICDQLEGKYPKDFVFTGWHPQCLCYAVPILKTEEEFWNYDKDNPEESVNEVDDVPKAFKDWVQDNKKRIEGWGDKLPYFLADNKEYMEEALNNAKEKDYPIDENYRGNIFARTLDNIQTALISKQFKNIESHKELSIKASSMLSKELGNPVSVMINPELMPLDIAKSHLTELISITKDYNIKQGKLTEITLGYNPKDTREYGVTSFSPSTNEKRIRLTSIIDKRDPINAITNSRCDENRLPFSLASHEGSHLLLSYNSPLKGEMNILKYQVTQLWKEYQKEFKTFIEKDNFEEAANVMLGTYGHDDPSEFMAECFQEYRNSSKPSKYALKIGKLLDSFFKK